MKRVIIILIAGLTIVSCSKPDKESRVKSLLVEQLTNTHTNQDWFVPTKTAIEGLSHNQSIWKDSTDNHSIIEIVSHLIFWNERILRAFKGEEVSDFNNDNEKTFLHDHISNWADAAIKLDSVQTAWEQSIQNATDDQIQAWSSEISNMAAHTAYHTGQIIYIRKQNGWWK